MRNVKVYNNFLKNINCSFKIRLFKISLSRSYIFNFDNNDIYYRKANVSRKIALVGKERAFLLGKKLKLELDLGKFNIKLIDNILSEYISYNYFSSNSLEDEFDIVEKKKKGIVTSDSIIRKFYHDEIVTMCFDDDKIFDMIWINNLSKRGKYNNMNNQIDRL